MGKKIQYKPKTCQQTRKTIYPSISLASRGKMHIWSHDPSADMEDMHVYLCQHAPKNLPHWHIGHKSYFQKTLEKKNKNVFFSDPI